MQASDLAYGPVAALAAYSGLAPVSVHPEVPGDTPAAVIAELGQLKKANTEHQVSCEGFIFQVAPWIAQAILHRKRIYDPAD